VSEGATQTIIRVVRLAIVAVIGVVIANAGQLIGLIPDENTKYLLSLVLVPLLDGIAKLIGGPTQALQRSVGRGNARLADQERPSFLSV
jgi:hypothetical protein